MEDTLKKILTELEMIRKIKVIELAERGYSQTKIGSALGIRASIDRGLRDCRYGIVVLSPDFFWKRWPQDELDGLFALEENGKTKILPIWHNLDKHQVAEFSPMLSGRMAKSSSRPISEMIDELKELLDS